MNLIRLLPVLLALAAPLAAQVAVKYTGATGRRSEPAAYKVPSTFSDTFEAGSTLTVNGTFGGTPTAGTLDLSNVTVTLNGSYLTAAQVNSYFADPSTNGSFSASAWRTDLGLSINTDVQAHDPNLDQLSGSAVSSSSLQEIDSARRAAGVNPRHLPQTGTIYAIGDSQTYGSNSATSVDYASGGRLLAAYRWVDMLATRDQRDLTISNLAVGGSKISWDSASANSYGQFSQFNAWGQIDYDWEGVIVMMCGWNNTSNTSTSDDFHTVMRRAYEAIIARALIDDYGGISINGWLRSGTGSSLSSWSTTGANNQYNYSVSADRRKVMPFYFGDATAARYRVDLDGTDYVQFTLANKRSAALFFETSADGGAIAVSVNGVVVWSGTSYYNSTEQFPQVVWLDNLPSSATIKFYGALSAGEHCFWLGAGWVDSNTSRARERTLVFGTTVANTFQSGSSRPLAMLQRLAKQAEAAAAAFSDYPVYFADVFNAWVQSTDQEPQDESHLTAVGNEHVYSAFRQASRLSLAYSPNRVDVQRVALESALAAGANGQIRLAPSTGPVLIGTSSARLNYSAGSLKFQMEGTSTTDTRVGLVRNSNDNAAGLYNFAKTRSASTGGSTVVQSGDALGSILFSGADGANLISGASMTAAVDGTPGTNDMPTRLVFNTTPDGSSSQVERLRIDSSGRFFFANNTVSLTIGTGDPEGVVTAAAGSLFLRTDGSTSTTLYVKTSGSGNNGWTAK